jgi:trehalose 6-phosphate synthase
LSITYKGHQTLVRPFPISVDFEEIYRQAESESVIKAMENIPNEIDPPYEILAIGIDRVDYTKGIIEKKSIGNITQAIGIQL